MKRCPTCTRVYDGDDLRFCLDDGTELVNKSPDMDAPTTAILPASPKNVQPTIQTPPPPIRPAGLLATVPAAAGKRRSLLPWLFGGVLLLVTLAAIIVAVVVLLPKAPLTWHLVLLIRPPVSADQNAVVNQTVAVIKNRLNAASVSHFEIKSQGTQIFLDLPAMKDPERIKHLIGTGGKLELVHVISPISPAPAQTYDTKQEATASLNSGESIPANRRVLPYSSREDFDAPASKKWVVVESPPIVDGTNIRDASAAKNSYGPDYDIMFSLNKAGAEKFGSWTESNINQYIGVVLNDEVRSIAFIKSQITDQGEITGRFTQQAAQDLALVLKSGALPAPIEFQEERFDR